MDTKASAVNERHLGPSLEACQTRVMPGGKTALRAAGASELEAHMRCAWQLQGPARRMQWAVARIPPRHRRRRHGPSDASWDSLAASSRSGSRPGSGTVFPAGFS